MPYLPRPARRLAALSAAVVLASAGLAGCSEKEEDSDVVALLLPSTHDSRYADIDEPDFAARLKEACPDCTLVSYNAEGSAKTQAEQFDKAREAGADVVVLGAVDAEGGKELVSKAGDVPVVGYDHFLPSADWYVGRSAGAAAKVEAEALFDAMPGGKDRSTLILTGPATDPNTPAATRAAERTAKASGVAVAGSGAAEDWSPEAATRWLEKQFEKTPPAELDGILTGSDTQAQAAIAALDKAGVPAADRPRVAGVGASLDAVRRVVQGTQAVTVHPRASAQASQAADIAASLILDLEITGEKSFQGVPSFLFGVRAVTPETVTDTVVRDQAYPIEEICSKQVAARCAELGIR